MNKAPSIKATPIKALSVRTSAAQLASKSANPLAKAIISMAIAVCGHAHAQQDAIGRLLEQRQQGMINEISSAPMGISKPMFYQSYANASNIKAEHIDLLHASEQQASASAQKVLKTVRQMALDDREIIKGACWDYLNAAFKRAGVSRETVFKGKYPNGPFVDTGRIQAGDWLYYVNHSYRGIEHSGLFIGWIDRANNQALILSYAGEHRHEPARYRVYDISHTYNIMRPKP